MVNSIQNAAQQDIPYPHVKSILCWAVLHVECSTQLLLPSSPLFVITVDRAIWCRSLRFGPQRQPALRCLTPFSICIASHIARVTKWPRTLMSLTLISLNFQQETSETLRITNKGNCVSSHDDELVFRARPLHEFRQLVLQGTAIHSQRIYRE